MDQNVHNFTQSSGMKEILPSFFAVDSLSDRTQDVETVLANIKKTLQDLIQKLAQSGETSPMKAKQNTLDAAFEKLLFEIKKKGNIEKETGAHVPELLSRIWTLMQVLEDDDKASFLTNLCLTFCDNPETGRGCYGGFAGRLAVVYIDLMRKVYEPQITLCTPDS